MKRQTRATGSAIIKKKKDFLKRSNGKRIVSRRLVPRHNNAETYALDRPGFTGLEIHNNRDSMQIRIPTAARSKRLNGE